MNASFSHRLSGFRLFARHRPLPFAAAVLAAALTVWFSIPVLESLNSIWLVDADYTHGYLAFALTAVLIYFEIRRRPLAPAAPSWVGAACFVALLFVVICGLAATTEVVAQLALPVLWVAGLWALSGARNATRFVAPLSYTFFAVPIWNLLIDPMRHLTIRVVSIWTRAAGMPAFIDGNLIHVPTGTFEVEGGCAGLRYMLVAGALTVFTSLLHRRRLGSAALLVGSAALLALIGNWVRVFLTVAAGLSPEGSLALFVHNNHTLFGWLLFVVFMVPVFYLERVLESRPAKPPGAATYTGGGSSGAWHAFAICAFLTIGIWLSYRIGDGLPEPRSRTPVMPAEIAGWSRTTEWQDSRLPAFIGPSQQAASWYSDGASEIGVYVAHYASQRQEHEVVFLHNHAGGAFARVVAQRPAANADPAALSPFRELEVLDAENRRRLVWVELDVAGRRTANDFVAKGLQVLGAVRGRRDAQVLVLSAVCAADCSDARSQLSRFAATAADMLFAEADAVVGPGNDTDR